MVKVIAGFRDKETQIVYVIGDDYEGDRVAELRKKLQRKPLNNKREVFNDTT
mgnify:CR=1 FL=1